ALACKPRRRAPAGPLLLRIGRSLRSRATAHGRDPRARACSRTPGWTRLERMARALERVPRSRPDRAAMSTRVAEVSVAPERWKPSTFVAASMGLHGLAGAGLFLGADAWPWA